MGANILKVLGYFLITSLIGLMTQLDTYGYDVSKLTNAMWVGMVVKSLLPGLISIRAYLDIPHSNDKS